MPQRHRSEWRRDDDQHGPLHGCGHSRQSRLEYWPSDAQELRWNASANKWVAVNVSGDATETNAGVVTVSGLQGRTISNAAPGAGQVLTWNNSTTKWDAEAAQAAATPG